MYGCALKISEIIILLESMSIAIYSVVGVEWVLGIFSFSFEPLYRKRQKNANIFKPNTSVIQLC